MTTTLPALPVPADHAPAVREAWDAYFIAVTEHGPADRWDAQVIDGVIAHLAAQGEPFSCNDFRDLLPPVRTALISRRLIAAQHSGLVAKTGYTPSTLPSTHGHPVAVYQPLTPDG